MKRHALLHLASLTLLIAPTLGHAFTSMCVSDAQGFSQALAAAGTSTDTLIVIRLRQGTYDAFAATQRFSYAATHSNQLLEISGGWSGPNNTCQTNAQQPALTQIVGRASDPALQLSTGQTNGTSGNQVYLHDVSISGTYSGTNTSGACLRGFINWGNQMRVERVQLHDCVALKSSFGSAAFYNDGGQLLVRDVAAFNAFAVSTGGISVGGSNGSTSELSHISVTNAKSMNNSSSFNAGIFLNTADLTSTISLANSVSWGNGGNLDDYGQPVITNDVVVSGKNISLLRVHRGTLKGVPASDTAASDGDPSFVSYNDAHLRADSLLIDTGVSNPGSGSGLLDADGRARTAGAGVDVGAFEADPDRLFANGFDL